MKNKQKSYLRFLVPALVVLVAVPLVLVLVVRYEGEKPTVELKPQITAIGAVQKMTLDVADERSGIRSIWVALVKDGKESVVQQVELPSAGWYRGGQVHRKTLPLVIEPRKLGFGDGRAILRLVVRDYSWRDWWHGNRTYLEQDVVIDTRPPEVAVLSRVHNVTQGGSALAIYRLSEPCPESGVVVGDNFFPGSPGHFEDAAIHLAFFALNHRQGPGTELFIRAVDRAGNRARTGFPHHIRKKRFKTDTIRISDRFLNWKMPEFASELGSAKGASALETFLVVNRKLRLSNTDQLRQITSRSDAEWFWEGRFLRLPGAANRAGFADHRSYTHNGKEIDQQHHMGVDLASVAHSPIPAANGGKIVHTGAIGIFGKTVVIDHGFGLFSMYSHLSKIDVQAGQHVAKGEELGRTGLTGLAGGDHLHFGMMVHNTFVNPLEWWDAVWIRHNITSKLDTVPASPARTAAPAAGAREKDSKE